jgi:hypothetical protein
MPHEAENIQLKARIRDLEAALSQNDHTLALAFALPPRLSDLLGLLLNLPVVTSDMIRQRLEIATDAKVAVHRLRKHVDKFGIKIEGRRGFGYWLTEETKAAIWAAVTPQVTVLEEESEEAEIERALH